MSKRLPKKIRENKRIPSFNKLGTTEKTKPRPRPRKDKANADFEFSVGRLVIFHKDKILKPAPRLEKHAQPVLSLNRSPSLGG